MGKLKRFELTLTDHSLGVAYQPGEVITGQLYLDLAEPMKMETITLKLLGKATVQWRVGDPNNSQSICNDETYVNDLVYVWGSAAGRATGFFDTTPVHPGGQHIYPFRFQLPIKIPDSFIGQYGIVGTGIMATINRRWDFDHTATLTIEVKNTYDLNNHVNAWNACEGRALRSVGHLCCKSGPLSIVCHLERIGYVPGEFIVVNAEVDNKSNCTLTRTKFILRRVTTFHARGNSRSNTVDITVLKRGKVAAGDSEIWNGERLHIPLNISPQLHSCSIIDIKYFVVVVTYPIQLECAVGIVIGTIPLQNNNGQVAMNTSFTQALPPPPPPPSYAESMGGKVNEGMVSDECDSEYRQGTGYKRF